MLYLTHFLQFVSLSQYLPRQVKPITPWCSNLRKGHIACHLHVISRIFWESMIVKPEVTPTLPFYPVLYPSLHRYKAESQEKLDKIRQGSTFSAKDKGKGTAETTYQLVPICWVRALHGAVRPQDQAEGRQVENNAFTLFPFFEARGTLSGKQPVPGSQGRPFR